MRSAAVRPESPDRRCDSAGKKPPGSKRGCHDRLRIFSLIYGPILVTLACWFIFTVEVRRAKKDVVIYVLSQKRHRLHRERSGC
jgi:hypothetical protein